MIHHLRQEYDSDILDIQDLSADPIQQFDRWFQDALLANVAEPNAMTLATAAPDGKPSARIVLLKDYSPAGFTFFTNYESRKGQQLDANPNAALNFFWREMHRQVCIEGTVEKVDRQVSEAYFQSRPLGSQIGAWASRQSSVLENRAVLDVRVQNAEGKFAGLETLPVPEYWGGYLLRPSLIEFWQGRPSRLHDRFLYSKPAGGEWKIERLSP